MERDADLDIANPNISWNSNWNSRDYESTQATELKQTPLTAESPAHSLGHGHKNWKQHPILKNN